MNKVCTSVTESFCPANAPSDQCTIAPTSSGACKQAMIDAKVEECSATKTTNCFTITPTINFDKITYTGTNDLKFNKTIDISSCDLSVNDAELYIGSDVTLKVHDLTVYNKNYSSAQGIFMNDSSARIEANDITATASDDAIYAKGNITAHNIKATSDTGNGLYTHRDNVHVKATGNIEAYCLNQKSSGWAIWAIGSLEAGGYILGEGYDSGIHIANGVKTGSYLKGIGGSVNGVHSTMNYGKGLDLSGGSVDIGGDMIGISHMGGIYWEDLTSVTVGGNLIGKNEWGGGNQGLYMSYCKDINVSIHGNVEISCANGAAHNNNTSYGACFHNHARMTVGGNLTSINSRTYRDNHAVRNWGYLSVGGNLTAESYDDAIDMAGDTVGHAQLYVEGDITATSSNQDGIDMTNSAIVQTNNGSIYATGKMGIDISNNCKIIAQCKVGCHSGAACTGTSSGSIVATGSYNGIHCDNNSATIQADGDIIGRTTGSQYQQEAGIYSWAKVQAGQCILGEGYIGIDAYPGQGMGCNRTPPSYIAGNVRAKGTKYDVKLSCTDLPISCIGTGIVNSMGNYRAGSGCCYYWNNKQQCMPTPTP